MEREPRPRKDAGARCSLGFQARIISASRYFTIHLVLSSRTQGLVGQSELGLMKPSARLVNTSRGPIVDEAAFVDALRNRHIAGAAIDVFDIEPIPRDHPLRQLDTVITTPHIGYVSRDLYRVFYQDTVRISSSGCKRGNRELRNPPLHFQRIDERSAKCQTGYATPRAMTSFLFCPSRGWPFRCLGGCAEVEMELEKGRMLCLS
jgi:phosphoglycerate dehydrogenase-like enzyme